MSKMRIVSDLDWSTMICPCGASIHGSEGHEVWEEFEKTHAKHTDGDVLNSVSDDGARAYSEKPKSYISKL